MKKTVIIMLLLCLVLPVFADDALVLPAGVFRFTLVPSYDFVPGAYGTNGSYTGYNAGQGKVTAFDAAAALEYGVNDWISAAVQWTPGWNMSSSVDTNWATVPVGPRTSNANVNGLYDAVHRCKGSDCGRKSPGLQRERSVLRGSRRHGAVRRCEFCQQQWTNYTNGNNVTVANVDIQTLGLGSRIYLDYVFSPAFFLNLYSQFLYYPGTVAFKDTSFQDYVTYFFTASNPNVGFGYDLTVEVEPHYIYNLSDGVQLQGSLPFTYTYSPQLTFDGVSQSDTSQSLIVMRPTIDLFLLKSAIPFPLELKLAYSLPLVGWNTGATNAVILIIRMYFKV